MVGGRIKIPISLLSLKPVESTYYMSLRNALLRYGHVFYRRHLKRTRVGRLIGKKLLKNGWITAADLQISALSFGFVARIPENPEGRSEANLTQVEARSAVPGFHLSPPLNLDVSDALIAVPRINVLLPSLRLKHLSGGPNTALLFAVLLAEKGEYIRILGCDAPAEGEEEKLFAHMDGLLLRPVQRERIELVDAFDRSRPTFIGANDLFFATAWWTAQMARYAVNKTIHKKFVYLIQDFEPILHEASTLHARALETYALEHIPIINTKLLLDHLIKEQAGCYADAEFASQALWFEPAIDRDYYFPDRSKAATPAKKTLIFYARPTAARRNLFEIGVVALQQAVEAGVIDKDNWEVWAMGEKLAPMSLGNGVFLNPLPWMSFEVYAERVRSSDLLLSLMLSPHPSYPPLEMAASGKMVVTNSFSVKTSVRMKHLSPNILVAEPSAESIAASLINAVSRINAGLPSHDPTGTLALPSNWDDSLRTLVPTLLERIKLLRSAAPAGTGPLISGYPVNPKTRYEAHRIQSLARRRWQGNYHQRAGLLSFVTSAYNTDPRFLEELGRSLFHQDGGTNFEWLILDNGSTREDTRLALQALGAHPAVRLERVERNLGIIGGMRLCLECASGQYILPLDSDDLIEPDCVHVLTRFIEDHHYPPLLYTDEDKFDGDRFGSAYFKPDWDPVLFVHSCYIAHLCAIDRKLALELGLYTNPKAEGCHDWDSFIRFMGAGYEPLHLREVLYSWRIHGGSTSGNISSKSYITESHRNVLEGFLRSVAVENIDLVTSPLFDQSVDWWFRRRRVTPQSMFTITIGPENIRNSSEDFLFLPAGSDLQEMASLLQDIDSDLIHIQWHGVQPDDDEWQWDAMALVELFQETVMVGGILHDGNHIIEGPLAFGFGDGLDSPDTGRLLADPGYGACMYKPHSVSSVPTGHCVLRTSFLKEFIAEFRAEGLSVDMVGPWLGAYARELGKRVVYSPFMRAQVNGAYASSGAVCTDREAKFLSRFWRYLPDHRLYSLNLGLERRLAYAEVVPHENLIHLNRLQASLESYPIFFQRHLNGRLSAYPVPTTHASITLMTTIYEHTSIALLDELAASIVGQTLKSIQWVLVLHGPISPSNIEYIKRQSENAWAATVVVEPQPLGIMGAMQRGLDAAQGEYIVPVDADDLLTADAIEILTSVIERRHKPDMVFSDEDLLVEGQIGSPYWRGVFDPVLNLDSSYIWHLCAIRRVRAQELGLYADSGATWCHDWNSVMRIASAGGRIEHVPEVLYHWRQHTGSTTNKPEGDPRSFDSIRFVLNRHIRSLPRPEHFYVAEWPQNRGAPELYIARRPEDLPQLVWIGDASDDALACAEDAILVATNGVVFIESQEVYLEAIRLFELHPQIGAVGGLVDQNDGLVVDACYMLNQAGELESPWLGLPAGHSGPYALALKPQTVATTGHSLAFFRVSALRQSGAWPVSHPAGPSGWMIDLCGKLSENGWDIAFSPLVKGRFGTALASTPNRSVPPAGTRKAEYGLVRYGRGRNYNG
jgi:glycosyltransferase involved in cell wall biosynthesis